MAPEAAKILEFLGDCSERQRRFQGQRGLIIGCSVGCILALTVAILQIWMDFTNRDRIATTSLIPVAMLVGYLRGRRCGWSFAEAAAVIDRRFNRKDAITSAVSFAEEAPFTDWHRLLIQDVSDFLATITPADVAIRQLPKGSWYLIPTAASAISMVWLLPALIHQERGVQTSVPGISEAAGLMQLDLQQLREMLKDTDDPDSTELLNQIDEQLKRLRDPNITLQEAFALLSSVQQQLERYRSRLGRSIANQHLTTLGETIASVAEMHDPAAALQDLRFNEAAASLESIPPPEVTSMVNPDAARMLSELAEAMKQAGLSELAADVSELAEHLSGTADRQTANDPGEVYQHLAESLRKQATQEGLADLLAEQNRRLNHYKSLLREAGQSDGSQSSLADGSETRDEPDRQAGGETNLNAEGGGLAGTGGGHAAGSTSAGNQQGAPTSIESTRQLSSLTGTLSSDGPATVEKVPSDETPNDSATSDRELQTVDATFRRTSQAAMDEDQIPWQYRETIRRYFEGLRLAEDRNRRRK